MGPGKGGARGGGARPGYVLPSAYAPGAPGSYREGVTTFDRLAARARALPPLAADLLVVAVVGLLTGSDLAVNDPGYRQADALSWALFAVSLAALVVRRRRPVPVACVTGAACAGWALYGHIGELLNLPVIVALYTVAVLGDRRRTLWTGVTAAVVSGVVALIVGRDVVNPQGLPVLEMIWPLVPLLLGEAVRTRRELLAEYAARAERAEAEREREAARRIAGDRSLDGVRVVMLTTYQVDAYVFEALRHGAAGFLLKDIEPDDLRAAIRTVAEGRGLLDPAVTRRVIEEFARLKAPEAAGAERLAVLTGREREVMALVAGLSNEEIGRALIMSPLTAKTHVSQTMTKLGARDRAQLVVLAYETGLVRPGEH